MMAWIVLLVLVVYLLISWQRYRRDGRVQDVRRKPFDFNIYLYSPSRSAKIRRDE
ncbi:hypothetical protein [Chitinibacter sp. S2-10]|uniref:hypothetical protein n=1 Tax=Chitinibacter sp. S2-10 TaxID=3373597 RepID=UPI003977D69C